jgi:hypothetical protein
MKKSNLRLLPCVFATVLTALACGGKSQAPAEAPSEPSTEPASEPAPTETADAGMPEGEHTMPDGTTMPGHQH